MEFIIEWERRDVGQGFRFNRGYIKGPWLYIPINSSPNQFRVIYLNKEINNENWAQYIRSYEKVLDGKSRTVYYCEEQPTYANRWTEIFYENGFQQTIHFYRSHPSLKSKIDRIRNSVCKV